MSVERKGDAKILQALAYEGQCFLVDDIVRVTVYDSKKDLVDTFIGRIMNIEHNGLYVMFDISTACHSQTIKVTPINIYHCERVNENGDTVD